MSDIDMLIQKKRDGYDIEQDESVAVKTYLRRLLDTFPLECDEVLTDQQPAQDAGQETWTTWMEQSGAYFKSGREVLSAGQVAKRLTDLTATVKRQGERVSTLFDAIKHGDEEHQWWLKQAIEDHFARTAITESGEEEA